jgi:hypothetical protein
MRAPAVIVAASLSLPQRRRTEGAEEFAMGCGAH